MIRNTLGVTVILSLLLVTVAVINWTLSADVLAQDQQPTADKTQDAGSTNMGWQPKTI